MWTLTDIQNSPVASLNTHLFSVAPVKKSKYGNRRTVVDGISFMSIREAKRYRILKMLQKKGIIAGLKLQQDFELNQGGTHSLIYRACVIEEFSGPHDV